MHLLTTLVLVIASFTLASPHPNPGFLSKWNHRAPTAKDIIVADIRAIIELAKSTESAATPTDLTKFNCVPNPGLGLLVCIFLREPSSAEYDVVMREIKRMGFHAYTTNASADGNKGKRNGNGLKQVKAQHYAYIGAKFYQYVFFIEAE